LHYDGTISVRIKKRGGLATVVIRFAPDGAQNLDVIDQDGTILTSVDRAGTVLVKPIGTQAA